MNMKNFSKEVVTLLNVAILFFLAIILLYSMAPLLGGIFSLSAVIYYSSFVGITLIAKYFLKKYEKITVISKSELLFKILYESICYFLWFETPIAIFFLLFGLVINIVGYRAYSNKLVKKGEKGADPN